MKKLLAALAGVSVLAICAPASAAVYAGFGYSKVDVEDVTLKGYTARVGWQSDSFYGVEGELSVGDRPDSIGGSTFDLKHNIAVFGVVHTSIAEKFDVHARLGFGSAKIEETGLTPGNFSESGVAYGVGGSYNFGEKTSLRVDLTRQDFDGSDADSFSFGFIRKF